MKEKIKFLVKAIMAGIMIAIGGTIFLSMEDKIVGATLFSIGLFIIVTRELNLYTGKVGYIFNEKPKYLIEVLITVIGNFIGTFLVGFLLKYTRVYNSLHTKASAICSIKLNDDLISILILSVFCGILMYLAVNSYKVGKDVLHKYIPVFMGVIVFILCGFEHSIANMYYFTMAGWTAKSFGYLGIMILGNLIGCVSFPLLEKLNNCLEKEKKNKKTKNKKK